MPAGRGEQDGLQDSQRGSRPALLAGRRGRTTPASLGIIRARLARFPRDRRIGIAALCAGGAFVLAFPLLFSAYQTNIMISALTYVVLGLGLGFLAIWPLDRLVSRSGPPHGAWWPFIPGTILLVVGLAGMMSDPELVMELVVPIAMVIVGAGLAIRALVGKSKEDVSPPAPPAS